jgi:hypothetical protein
MTRGDWAGGGVRGVCVGKSEVCHFAIIVSNLSRHQQRQERLEEREGTTRRQAANKWQWQLAAATRQECSVSKKQQKANSPLLQYNQSVKESTYAPSRVSQSASES